MGILVGLVFGGEALDDYVMFRAYEDNEVAADQKYKGKSLLVTGTVQSIDKGFTDSIVVKLAAGNPFMPLHAYLDDQHAAMVASLKKGGEGGLGVPRRRADCG